MVFKGIDLCLRIIFLKVSLKDLVWFGSKKGKTNVRDKITDDTMWPYRNKWEWCGKLLIHISTVQKGKHFGATISTINFVQEGIKYAFCNRVANVEYEILHLSLANILLETKASFKAKCRWTYHIINWNNRPNYRLTTSQFSTSKKLPQNQSPRYNLASQILLNYMYNKTNRTGIVTVPWMPKKSHHLNLYIKVL